MNENPTNSNNLLDTTDCLEAVGVFRGWKNGLFVIVILCLLLLQISFWLVDFGFIGPCDKSDCGALATVDKKAEEIKAAAEIISQEPNKSVEAELQKTIPPSASDSKQAGGFIPSITIKHLCWTIRFVNVLLILTAVLYCLCMLFSLKVSLIGRLGGINHISRAFFLSLILVILLLPWQVVFDGIIPGVIYTPCEMVRRCSAERSDIFAIAIHYLRFTGYWLLVVLFLVFAQLRSSRWTRSVLHRLEVI